MSTSDNFLTCRRNFLFLYSIFIRLPMASFSSCIHVVRLFIGVGLRFHIFRIFRTFPRASHTHRHTHTPTHAHTRAIHDVHITIECNGKMFQHIGMVNSCKYFRLKINLTHSVRLRTFSFWRRLVSSVLCANATCTRM